jgi:hypothetical protein
VAAEKRSYALWDRASADTCRNATPPPSGSP